MLDTPSASEDVRDLAAAAGAVGEMILLADDNADMRNYIERLLRSAGFLVESVPDGEMALAAARRTRPDLVLSDVMMPKLDGFGLLAALREEPEFRDVPVLLLSARAGEEAKIEGLSAGADDHLTKPFSARSCSLACAPISTWRRCGEKRCAPRTNCVAERKWRKSAPRAYWRASRMVFAALDPDWRFIYVNAAAERMMGRAHGDLIGKPQLGGISAHCRHDAGGRLASGRWRTGSASLSNTMRLLAAGTIFVFIQLAMANLSLYFQDITERKEAVDCRAAAPQMRRCRSKSPSAWLNLWLQGSPPARHI